MSDDAKLAKPGWFRGASLDLSRKFRILSFLSLLLISACLCFSQFGIVAWGADMTGDLNFILFLIPGLPKDVFTYIFGLTDMKLGTFLLLSTLGRTPGVFVSSFAASSIMEGDFTTSAIMFGTLAVLAALGVIFRDRIMDRFAK